MTDSVDRDLARGLVGHPTADPVTEAVIARIKEIARQHERVMREVTARHGVSLADCEVIFHLAHSDGDDAQHTPGHLAKAFQITAGSMTSRLDRLERGGYIERRIDPNNRVNIKVTLTPAGHALHHETVEDIVALRRALISNALSPDASSPTSNTTAHCIKQPTSARLDRATRPGRSARPAGPEPGDLIGGGAVESSDAHALGRSGTHPEGLGRWRVNCRRARRWRRQPRRRPPPP